MDEPIIPKQVPCPACDTSDLEHDQDYASMSCPSCGAQYAYTRLRDALCSYRDALIDKLRDAQKAGLIGADSHALHAALNAQANNRPLIVSPLNPLWSAIFGGR